METRLMPTLLQLILRNQSKIGFVVTLRSTAQAVPDYKQTLAL
jgi:hypothetical protein